MSYFLRRIFIGILIIFILGAARRAMFSSHIFYGPSIFRSVHLLGAGGSTVSAASSEKAPTAEYYCPAENLERVDTVLLSQEKADHLDLAMYSFTDRALADELLNLARSGVKIRLYRDNQQYSDELRRDDSVIRMLAGNENIQVRVKDHRELMHLKAWSNGRLLREGSANWSVSGEKHQDNSLFVLRDQASVRAFEHEFDAMWNRSDNEIVQ